MKPPFEPETGEGKGIAASQVRQAGGVWASPSPRQAGSALRHGMLAALALAALGLGGCVSPIGTEPVSTRRAYAQVEASALRTGKPSASTVTILHRYGLGEIAAKRPDEAVRQLHQKAQATGDRDLLFALAELSFVAGDAIRDHVKPWDTREARDFYLGSAIYAWLFLFGEGEDDEASPSPFDRRFRGACDLYNYSLGLAFADTGFTNGMTLVNARRRLPVGQIDIQLSPQRLPRPIETFEQIFPADQFRVRGMSTRNREPGMGAALICVAPPVPPYGLRPSLPATMFLRGPKSLADLSASGTVVPLEIHSSFEEATVMVRGRRVPLEVDLTTHRAYVLSDSRVWRLGPLGFLAPAERIRNQLLLHQPYQPDRIPLVLVHGTFSSPVTWAEMVNSLTADPEFRQRYQVWSFVYGSGNPLVQSVADLRMALKNQLELLDPAGTNPVLRQMVVIGHSQGGLLTKGTVVDSSNRLWRVFTTNRLEDLKVTEKERANIRSRLFLEPLPFVKRVVFIATPHRGSYLAGSLPRRLAQRLVSLPSSMVSRTADFVKVMSGSEAEKFFRGKLPTSLDGMSPKNPGLIVLSEIPVAPGVHAHSIIPVRGRGDYRRGRDGLVSYESAHMDGVDSEYIVRWSHTCLNQPETIEEVRRILHEHLQQVGPTATASGAR